MIVDERMRTYINSLDMGNPQFLEELEQYAICLLYTSDAADD